MPVPTQRQRGELVSIGEVIADLPGPVQALRKAPQPAQRHFTQADQVHQLVTAREAEPDMGFMARLLAWLCSEAVKTQSRELILGNSLAEFMRILGVYSTGGDDRTLPDPEFDIFKPDGNRELVSLLNNNDGAGNDERVEFTADQTGTYFIDAYDVPVVKSKVGSPISRKTERLMGRDSRAGLKNGSLATGRKERGLRGKEVEGN